MSIELTVAIVGFAGVLIGFFGNLAYQAIQQNWERDEKRREWKRKQLESSKNQFSSFMALMHSIILTEPEERVPTEEFQLEFSKWRIGFDTPLDKELDELNQRLTDVLVTFGSSPPEEFVTIADSLREINRSILRRLNELIEATYK